MTTLNAHMFFFSGLPVTPVCIFNSVSCSNFTRRERPWRQRTVTAHTPAPPTRVCLAKQHETTVKLTEERSSNRGYRTSPGLHPSFTDVPFLLQDWMLHPTCPYGHIPLVSSGLWPLPPSFLILHDLKSCRVLGGYVMEHPVIWVLNFLG